MKIQNTLQCIIKIFKKIFIYLGVYFFTGCTQFKDIVIDIFTPEYKVEAKELRPEFISKDAQRKKIILKLKEEFVGLPQITSLVPFPIEKNLYFATIKTGELMLYNFSTKESFILKRFDVLTSSEQGLLGIAFHPEFLKHPYLYLHYSIQKNKHKYGRISEFTLKQNLKKNNQNLPFIIEKERILLEIEQPYANHNGGHLEFGPDGYLYIGLGDGGWRDDIHNHSQNPNTLLGSMLRIDVKPSSKLPYSIPRDNPFIEKPEWREEIFAIGLRNPWKYSFDPYTKRLIVADVGQDQYEEISIVEKGNNYGWRIKEGFHCYLDTYLCNRKDLIDPIYVYDHSEGQSITGGYVYTANRIKEINGKYIFGDFVQGKIWAIELPPNNQKISEEAVYSLGKWPLLISTFSYSLDGEVFVCDFQSGKIYSFAK